MLDINKLLPQKEVPIKKVNVGYNVEPHYRQDVQEIADYYGITATDLFRALVTNELANIRKKK